MRKITPKMREGWAKQAKWNAKWREENPDWPVNPSPARLKELLKGKR